MVIKRKPLSTLADVPHENSLQMLAKERGQRPGSS